VKVRYLSIAAAEFREAIAWYRDRSLDTAGRFQEEVVVAEALLTQHPRIGRLMEVDVRGVCVNGFPYTLVYTVEGAEIVVISVAHHRREPGFWRDRLKT